MEPIGIRLHRLPIPGLRRVRDLEYFDGPLVSVFESSNGETYLAIWRDSDTTAHRWLLVRISRRDSLRYVHRSVTLLELIDGAKDGFVYLVDRRGGEMLAAYLAQRDELPSTYLPDADSYYDPELRPVCSQPATDHAILIEGEWELQDFADVPRRYRDVYSFLYLLATQKVAIATQRTFRYLFRGGYVFKTMFTQLADQVPPQDRVRIDSIQYASPGVIDVEVNDEVADLFISTIDKFKKAKLEDDYKELHAWVGLITGKRKPRKPGKGKKRKPERGLIDEHQALSLMEGIAKELGPIDLGKLQDLAGSTVQACTILLAYYRRVRDLAIFEAEKKAKFV